MALASRGTHTALPLLTLSSRLDTGGIRRRGGADGWTACCARREVRTVGGEGKWGLLGKVPAAVGTAAVVLSSMAAAAPPRSATSAAVTS